MLSKEQEPLSSTVRFLELMKTYGVSFDIDGVLANTSEGAVRGFNERYGFTYKNIKTHQSLKKYFAMSEWIDEIKRLDENAVEDSLTAAMELWNNDDNLRNAPIESGASALLVFLTKHDISPNLITSRPFATKDSTYHWLGSRFAHLNHLPGLLNMQNEANTINSDFKAGKAQELGVMFHFEDASEHAQKVAEKGIIVGLVEKPWNADYVPSHPLIVRPSRYNNRPEIIRTFLSLSDFVGENPELIQNLITARTN